MMALTAKQAQLLDFLKWYSSTFKRMPSFQEMMEGIGLKSKSGVHRLLSGLEERGFIYRLRDRARAIEIVENPHLPPQAGLSGLSVFDFIIEARRRGLVVGHYHRSSYRVGDETRTHRYFVEASQ